MCSLKWVVPKVVINICLKHQEVVLLIIPYFFRSQVSLSVPCTVIHLLRHVQKYRNSMKNSTNSWICNDYTYVLLPEHMWSGACSMTCGFCSQNASLYWDQGKDVFPLAVNSVCDKEMFLSNSEGNRGWEALVSCPLG